MVYVFYQTSYSAEIFGNPPFHTNGGLYVQNLCEDEIVGLF